MVRTWGYLGHISQEYPSNGIWKEKTYIRSICKPNGFKRSWQQIYDSDALDSSSHRTGANQAGRTHCRSEGKTSEGWNFCHLSCFLAFRWGIWVSRCRFQDFAWQQHPIFHGCPPSCAVRRACMQSMGSTQPFWSHLKGRHAEWKWENLFSKMKCSGQLSVVAVLQHRSKSLRLRIATIKS